MDISSVIIVCGPPASGKSVLSKELAASLKLPLLSKDDIKIKIYEAFEKGKDINDREISAASYSVLFNIFKELIKAKVNLIIESNFDNTQSVEKFLELRKEINFRPLTILCTADLETLHRRFLERDCSSERHSCLVTKKYWDFQCFYDNQNNIRSFLFDIGGEKIEYDAADFNQEKTNKIIEKVKEFITN